MANKPYAVVSLASMAAAMLVVLAAAPLPARAANGQAAQPGPLKVHRTAGKPRDSVVAKAPPKPPPCEPKPPARAPADG